ncbi:MAG: hypothetical protein ACD_76C00054G0008 [uncultured bacterium]|nr:MAG: hypothetical protein ACD_76C00054G0008 [uncultured bacterium]HBD05644.1 hypothetical protein [Candidatus Uhrbacteria bacterium]
MQSFPLKLGLTFGLFSGLVHLAWSVLVALGWAGPLMNWLFKIHFIQSPYSMLPFNLGQAVLLIVVAALAWFVFGFVVGSIWRAVAK